MKTLRGWFVCLLISTRKKSLLKKFEVQHSCQCKWLQRNLLKREDIKTYVKKGIGWTSLRSGSLSRTSKACLFLRNSSASSMILPVSAALTFTLWIDMSLRNSKKWRQVKVFVCSLVFCCFGFFKAWGDSFDIFLYGNKNKQR